MILHERANATVVSVMRDVTSMPHLPASIVRLPSMGIVVLGCVMRGNALGGTRSMSRRHCDERVIRVKYPECRREAVPCSKNE